jgi:hypothetical protein
MNNNGNNNGNNLNSYSQTRLESACRAVKESKNANELTRNGALSDLEVEKTLARNEIARLEEEKETASLSDQNGLDEQIVLIQNLLDACDAAEGGRRRRRRHARKTHRRRHGKRHTNKKSRKNRKH